MALTGMAASIAAAMAPRTSAPLLVSVMSGVFGKKFRLAKSASRALPALSRIATEPHRQRQPDPQVRSPSRAPRLAGKQVETTLSHHRNGTACKARGGAASAAGVGMVGALRPFFLSFVLRSGAGAGGAEAGCGRVFFW